MILPLAGISFGKIPSEPDSSQDLILQDQHLLLFPQACTHSHLHRNGPQIMALFVLPVLRTTNQPTFVDLVVASVSDNDMQIVQFVVCQLKKS